MNTPLANTPLGVAVLLLGLIAASVVGSVIYSIRQGHGQSAYFIDGLTGLPALALIPGLIWEGDARTTAAMFLVLAMMLYSQCGWWWFARRHGFQRAGQMTLILCLMTGVV